MKNPFEYTLAEIRVIAYQENNYEMRRQVEGFVGYLQAWQKEKEKYQVQKEMEKRDTDKPQPSRRRCRSLDQELLEACIFTG